MAAGRKATFKVCAAREWVIRGGHTRRFIFERFVSKITNGIANGSVGKNTRIQLKQIHATQNWMLYHKTAVTKLKKIGGQKWRTLGYEQPKERRTEAPRSVAGSVGEVGEVKLTEVGEAVGEGDGVGEGGKPLLAAASAAYAAGGDGAKGKDAGSSKACSTCGAATVLPSRWLAASKMASA